VVTVCDRVKPGTGRPAVRLVMTVHTGADLRARPALAPAVTTNMRAEGYRAESLATKASTRAELGATAPAVTLHTRTEKLTSRAEPA